MTIFVACFFRLRFLIDFGSNLAATWAPNPPQKPPKSHQKSIPNRILFLICFFDRFFINFASIFDPKRASFSLILDRFFDWFFMNFDLHFGSHFIDFEEILEPILLHFNIDVAAHTPVCRMSHRSPKARGGGDSPQAFSIYIYIYIYIHIIFFSICFIFLLIWNWWGNGWGGRLRQPPLINYELYIK